MSRTDVDYFVYRLFDADDQLLYIGFSMRPNHRLTDHRRDQPWADRIDRMHVDPRAYDQRSGRLVENLSIAVEKPLYNVTGQTDNPANRDVIRELYDLNECAAVSA